MCVYVVALSQKRERGKEKGKGRRPKKICTWTPIGLLRLQVTTSIPDVESITFTIFFFYYYYYYYYYYYIKSHFLIAVYLTCLH